MKQRTDIALLLAAVASAAVAPNLAYGDGMGLAPDPYRVYEVAQTAYLDWDQEAGREELSIMPRFWGDAREFVWIVPLPAVPEVSACESALFHSIRWATEPISRHRDEGWSCDNGYYAAEQAASDVGIISDSMVDVYRVLVLQSTDAGALADSLGAWGFLGATNMETVATALAEYVDAGWTFAAARVDSASVVAALPHIRPEAWYRLSLRPLTFAFAADRPVYPMRLSRLSADEEVWVELYVEADHRHEHPRLDAVYANRFSSDELVELRRRYPPAAERLTSGRFLTRLEGELAASHMDQDYYPRRSEDDREFRSIRYSGWPLTGLLFGGAALAWALRIGQRRRSANRACP